MSIADEQRLAEFLLGNADLARDVISAAKQAALIDINKYPDAKAKRLRALRRQAQEAVRRLAAKRGASKADLFKPGAADDRKEPRTTAHFVTRPQLVQKHILRFADMVAWVHEARRLGQQSGPSFQQIEAEGRSYEEIIRCALDKQPAPVSKEILLRRYVAAVLSTGGWPDTEWLAVVVATVLRDYPVNEHRLSGITEGILHGNRASGYTSTMRRRVTEYIKQRFSYPGRDIVDLGPNGFGVEHDPDSADYAVVREALTAMAPWGVPCFSEMPAQRGEERFADLFERHLETSAQDIPSETFNQREYLSGSHQDYPDDAGRRVMYRAHALVCVSCFGRVAADYEQIEIDARSGHPVRTTADARRLRFPLFREEVAL